MMLNNKWKDIEKVVSVYEKLLRFRVEDPAYFNRILAPTEETESFLLEFT